MGIADAVPAPFPPPELFDWRPGPFARFATARGPFMPLHRDDIVAFGAKSVSVILHRHDYRTIRIGYFDRQSRCRAVVLPGSREGRVGVGSRSRTGEASAIAATGNCRLSGDAL